MTLRRTVLWCGAGFAALLGVAALAVALAVYRPQFIRPWVERALTPRGGTASLGAMKLSLSPPTLEIKELTIAGPPQEGDLLRLDYLHIELIPRRYLHGGPWLRKVEIRSLVFERPRPRKTKGPPDLTPLTRLFDIETLSLSNARLRVATSQGTLTAERVNLSLVPGKGGIRLFSGDGEIGFHRKEGSIAKGMFSARGNVTNDPAIEVVLKLASARLTLPKIAGDGFGQIRLRVTPKHFQAEELILTLPQGRVRLGPQTTENLGPISLNAAVSATLTGKEPRIEVRSLDVGDVVLARGKLGGTTLEEISGTLVGEITRSERMKTILAPFLPDSLEGLGFKGRLPFVFHLSGKGTTRVMALELLPRELQVSWQSVRLGCRFGGTIRATSPLEGWNPGRATMGWNLSADAGDVVYEDRPLPLGPLEVRGTAEAEGGSFRVGVIDIQSGSLGHFTGKLSYRGGSVSGQLDGANLPVDSLASLAHSLSGQEWDNWSPTGAIEVAARLEPAGGGSRVTVTATLGQIGFSSPEGDVLGQNLTGKTVLEALLIPQPRMKAYLNLRGGEALWGTVYVDLSKAPLDLHVQGTRVTPEEYKDLELEGNLGGFGRLAVEGGARHAEGTWRHRGHLKVSDALLGPIFRTFIRDPLVASRRDLEGLEMDGTAAIDLTFSGSGHAADLAGSLEVRSGDMRRKSEPPLITGLDIDLPIAYSLGVENPGRSRPSDGKHWGRVSLTKLRLADQVLGPLEMPAVLVPNRLYLGGAIDLSLFGAKLVLRQISVDEPLSPRFRINTAAQLTGLDLAMVTGENPMLEGHLEGLLDPVAIGIKRMTASGELNGDLFGGRLEVSHVTVERPFSSGREIGADVNVRLIDLEQLSEALGIGRITGRLSGSIEELRVAYGQPVAFHLRMRSVPTKGVSQKVSLKAVNSISLVSTGSALRGLGSSLVTTFFKEFSYEKIGIESSLKNDVFTVRGLIHEDGVEYLVKRPLIGGINVINRNPDNRISFSDMVERVKRVTSERPN